MRTPTLVILFLFAPLAFAAENTIYLHGGSLKTKTPSDWIIVAHKPKGSSTAIAFHIPGNHAEDETADSTTLSIATFNLKETDAMLTFTSGLLEKAKEGESESEFEGWALREWMGQQEKTKYRIIDAKKTHEKLAAGIHLRLAWPLLDENPKDYDKNMKRTLTECLRSITKLNPDANRKKADPAD